MDDAEIIDRTVSFIRDETPLEPVLEAFLERPSNDVLVLATVRYLLSMRRWNWKGEVWGKVLNRFFGCAALTKFPAKEEYLRVTKERIKEAYHYDVPDPVFEPAAPRTEKKAPAKKTRKPKTQAEAG